jgi:fructose-bisphosphate aldolase class II
MVEVFNARDTAPLAIAALLKAGSCDVGPKAGLIEDPAHWTKELIVERATTLGGDKGPAGNFDD